MEINDLRKPILDFQKFEQDREWMHKDHVEISGNIMKINELRKANPANQRVTY